MQNGLMSVVTELTERLQQQEYARAEFARVLREQSTRIDTYVFLLSPNSFLRFFLEVSLFIFVSNIF